VVAKVFLSDRRNTLRVDESGSLDSELGSTKGVISKELTLALQVCC